MDLRRDVALALMSRGPDHTILEIQLGLHDHVIGMCTHRQGHTRAKHTQQPKIQRLNRLTFTLKTLRYRAACHHVDTRLPQVISCSRLIPGPGAPDSAATYNTVRCHVQRQQPKHVVSSRHSTAQSSVLQEHAGCNHKAVARGTSKATLTVRHAYH